MREPAVDSRVLAAWKRYPLRLSDGTRSQCCNMPTVLVQSMDGGFVTRNCCKCAKKDSLSPQAFVALHLWVACPECKQPMDPSRYKSNYCYYCEPCDLGIKLAHLLPRWTDL